MNGAFYLSSIVYMAQNEFGTVAKSAGLTQSHVDKLLGASPWLNTDRVAMKTALDMVIYSLSDLAMLPREDIPAECVAAVIACLVSPVNHFAAASWLANLKPARDLAENAQTAHIERVGHGRMLTLIRQAHGALLTEETYDAYAIQIQQVLGYSKAV